MWFFTPFGFFSAVQKPGTSHLTIRARVAADLDRLRATYLPELSATVVGGGTDYPYRARVSHAALGQALARMAQDIHYANFKSEVGKQLGYGRVQVYHQVWEALCALEQSEQPPAAPTAGTTPRTPAYGGVVVDAAGRILLHEPAGQFAGYVWTFPKGRAAPGESAEAAALREVQEETGVEAQIEERIPGTFRGETTENIYFLMSLRRVVGKPGAETQAIRWATVAEAPALIAQTRKEFGKRRDLAVLAAAVQLLERRHDPRAPGCEEHGSA